MKMSSMVTVWKYNQELYLILGGSPDKPEKPQVGGWSDEWPYLLSLYNFHPVHKFLCNEEYQRDATANQVDIEQLLQVFLQTEPCLFHLDCDILRLFLRPITWTKCDTCNAGKDFQKGFVEPEVLISYCSDKELTSDIVSGYWYWIRRQRNSGCQ